MKAGLNKGAGLSREMDLNKEAKKTELLGLTADELRALMPSLPAYRAKQLRAWLTALTPFSEMSNLPKNLRGELEQSCCEGYGRLHTRLVSADGTVKYLLELSDGSLIECVLMSYEHGRTVCISTQAGCAMGCAFCASTKGGLIRNLTPAELLFEVLFVNNDAGSEARNITNVVLMGTGEPLANYDNVIKFLRLLNSEETLGMSYRNISLSTCGIVPNMLRLAGEGMPVVLCLSLHAAFEQKRKMLMPIAENYTIRQALSAMEHYSQSTGRRVIIEYILLSGMNDGREDAQQLISLLAPLNCHVNLIPYNGVSEAGFAGPGAAGAHAFAQLLERGGVGATVRRSLGRDIDGACGQLRAKQMKL